MVGCGVVSRCAKVVPCAHHITTVIGTASVPWLQEQRGKSIITGVSSSLECIGKQSCFFFGCLCSGSPFISSWLSFHPTRNSRDRPRVQLYHITGGRISLCGFLFLGLWFSLRPRPSHHDGLCTRRASPFTLAVVLAVPSATWMEPRHPEYVIQFRPLSFHNLLRFSCVFIYPFRRLCSVSTFSFGWRVQ